MSHEITANVLKQSQQKGSRRLLLVILADQANAYGVAFPGVETLAAYANITERRVSEHIAGLEAARELFVYRREGLHNVYIVLPGLSSEQRAAAVTFINGQFRCKLRGDDWLKIDDLPPMEPAGVTPDGIDRGVGIDRGIEPLTESAGVPLTESTAPPDGIDSRSKRSVVVGISTDLDLNQQQQDTPPPRDPIPVEKVLFDRLQVGSAIWSKWLIHDPIAVVAAILHATRSEGIVNPPGLVRAMLEQGSSAPGLSYIGLAQRVIESGDVEIDQSRERYVTGEYAAFVHS